jgi:hypothetical protein
MMKNGEVVVQKRRSSEDVRRLVTEFGLGGAKLPMLVPFS